MTNEQTRIIFSGKLKLLKMAIENFKDENQSMGIKRINMLNHEYSDFHCLNEFQEILDDLEKDIDLLCMEKN